MSDTPWISDSLSMKDAPSFSVTVTINGDAGHPIVEFSKNGMWVHPDVPLDKTSRQFLDRVNAVWGSHIAAPAVKAERARIRARVQELRDNWHAYDEMNDVGVLVDAMYDAFDKLIVMLDEEDIPHEV